MRRRLPIGLVGMLALIVAVEGTLTRHAVEFATIWGSDWRITGRSARKTRGLEILVLGDSQAKFGLLPRVIEAVSGRRAYNLAVCVGQAPSSYFLLRRALQAGARPRALVVDFTPHLLAEPPQYNTQQWMELVGLGEAFDLLRSTRDPEFLGAVAVGRTLPSARWRFEIRDATRAALRGESPRAPGIVPANWRNWNLNRGAQVMPRNPAYRDRVDPSQATYLPANWRCDPVNLDYLKRFLRLAARQRIAVYWLLPPISPAIQAERERRGLDEQERDFVRAMLAAHPNLNVLDGRHAGYGPGVLWDAIHLDRDGATALSAAVAALIANPTPGRWQTLPAYRPPGPIEGLEDINQSMTVLHDPASRRR